MPTTKISRYDLGTSRAIEGGSQIKPLTPKTGWATPLTAEAGPSQENNNEYLDINEHMPNLSELNQPPNDVLKAKKSHGWLRTIG